MEFVSITRSFGSPSTRVMGKKPVGSISQVELLSDHMTGSAEKKPHLLFPYIRTVLHDRYLGGP
jgi:hypothetical protein